MKSVYFITAIFLLTFTAGCKSSENPPVSEHQKIYPSEDVKISNAIFFEKNSGIFLKFTFQNISRQPICVDRELIENKLSTEVDIDIIYDGKNLNEVYMLGFIPPRINDKKRIELGGYFEGIYQISGRFDIPETFSEAKIEKIYFRFVVMGCESNAGAKVLTEWKFQ